MTVSPYAAMPSYNYTPTPALVNRQIPHIQSPPPVSQKIKSVIQNNQMTWLMGVGCILMNFIPGLKMSWKMCARMTAANIVWMFMIDKGLGFYYRDKK